MAVRVLRTLGHEVDQRAQHLANELGMSERYGRVTLETVLGEIMESLRDRTGDSHVKIDSFTPNGREPDRRVVLEINSILKGQ